jgi:glycogen phosphorylase
MNFDKESFKESIRNRLKRNYGKHLEEASAHDIYDAVSSAVMDHIQTNWMDTRKE